MDENKVKKVNSRFFGRQRRIDFIEKLAYVGVAIFALALVVYMVTRKTDFVETNVDYAYLVNYMQKKGYNCEMLNRSGGSCTLRTKDYEYSFFRYDEGFQYTKTLKNYSLTIKHLDGVDTIEFKTFSGAYLGYKDKVYKCTTKKGVFSEIDKCVTDKEEVLDFESYTGFINEALYDLSNMVDASGYDKKVLLDNYEWVKK